MSFSSIDKLCNLPLQGILHEDVCSFLEYVELIGKYCRFELFDRFLNFMASSDDAHACIVGRVVMRIRRHTALKGEVIEENQCRGIRSNGRECFIPDTQAIKGKNFTSNATCKVNLGKKVDA